MGAVARDGLSTIVVGTFFFLSFSLGPVAIAATLMFLYLPVVYGFSILTGSKSFSPFKTGAISMIFIGAVFTTDLLGSFREPGVLLTAGAAFIAAMGYAMVFILTPSVASFTTLPFRSFAVSAVGLLGCLLILAFLPGLWHDLSDNWSSTSGWLFCLALSGRRSQSSP